MRFLSYHGHFLKRLGTFIHGTSGATPEQVYELVYPVGSYYLSMSDTFDPNVSFVGTWVQDTNGLMTMSASDINVVGNTGGEKAHALTESEVPAHSHSGDGVTIQGSANASFGNTTQYSYWNISRGTGLRYERIYDATMTPASAGSGTAHNNLQPYIVCVRWHRVS